MGGGVASIPCWRSLVVGGRRGYQGSRRRTARQVHGGRLARKSHRARRLTRCRDFERAKSGIGVDTRNPSGVRNRDSKTGPSGSEPRCEMPTAGGVGAEELTRARRENRLEV